MKTEVKEVIEIDGSQGEGGGQILRTALALSLITSQAFSLVNIRAKRAKPGLMRQHLACVQAAVAVGGGRDVSHAVDGAGDAVGVGASELHFTPGAVQAGNYEFAVGSAGSCMLVLQTVLWPLLMADAASSLVLRGGTHNPMAPSFSYLECMAPYFAGQGAPMFTMDLQRHGFYPAGGGEVRVQVTPSVDGMPLLRFLERGPLLGAWAECLHAGVPRGVADRELAVLQAGLGWQAEQLRNRGLRANEGPGNALQAVLQFAHVAEVVTAFGAKGVSAEEVGRQVLKGVKAYLAHTAPVGEHLADQLMIPLALAQLQGKSGSYLACVWSEHARTNASVIEQFLPVQFNTSQTEKGVLVEVA